MAALYISCILGCFHPTSMPIRSTSCVWINWFCNFCKPSKICEIWNSHAVIVQCPTKVMPLTCIRKASKSKYIEFSWHIAKCLLESTKYVEFEVEPQVEHSFRKTKAIIFVFGLKRASYGSIKGRRLCSHQARLSLLQWIGDMVLLKAREKRKKEKEKRKIIYAQCRNGSLRYAHEISACKSPKILRLGRCF